MCLGGGAPDVPDPVAPRQAARMPDAAAVSKRSQQSLLRKMSMAGTVTTTGNGLGAPATRGVALLGQ